jgi:uncharacterized protein YrrD
MLFSEANGRKVVATTTAATVGRVHGLVVDVRGPAVAALELKKTDSGDTLRWQDITAFGVDAVTVPGPERITDGGEDLGPLLDKANHVMGKRVLATSGDELGKVRDVDFDPESGYVLALLLENGFVEGKRLIGIGSYAVVVQAV